MQLNPSKFTILKWKTPSHCKQPIVLYTIPIDKPKVCSLASCFYMEVQTLNTMNGHRSPGHLLEHREITNLCDIHGEQR